MSNSPNYAWIILTLVSGTQTFTSNIQSCDCFKYLRLTEYFSGNISLATINVSLDWYDQNRVFIFTETFSGATSSYNFYQQIDTKGAYCRVRLSGAVDSGFIYSLFGVLTN